MSNTKNNENLVRRWIVFTVGMFLMGTGIAFMIKGAVGVSPISCVTTIMHDVFPVLTVGMFSFVLNFVMFIGEFIVDPKSFSISKFTQLIPTVISSFFIDINIDLVMKISLPEGYIIQILALILGCAVLGFSLFLMVDADVILMPNEAFISAVADKYNREWGNVRTVIDIAFVIFSAVVGLLVFREVRYIREGTLISAIIVGQFCRLFTNLWVAMVKKKEVTTAPSAK